MRAPATHLRRATSVGWMLDGLARRLRSRGLMSRSSLVRSWPAWLMAAALAGVGCNAAGHGRDGPASPTVLFLEHEAVTLTAAGHDDAALGRSSLLAGAGLSSLAVPAAPFEEAAFAALVDCVRDRFAAFHVSVVDARPAEAGFHMVVFGADAGMLTPEPEQPE